MAAPVALVLYALVLVPAVVVVWRRPVLALFAFLVGLAVYNFAAALLYGAGVHGNAIEAIQTWKEILLATAALRVGRDAWVERRLPFRPHPVDWLALAFAALVVLYALVPQGVLDGNASANGVLKGLRHDLTPVLAYFVGRSLYLGRRDLVALGWTLAGTAGLVAAFGLIDLYAVPISWWRDSGAVGFFRHQGYDYHGPGGLPENFVFNLGAEDGVFRRLTSTFLGPLGTAYVLGIALLAAAAGGPLRRRPWLLAGLVVLWSAALLMTLSRSTIAGLAGALVVLAIVLPRRWPIAAAAVTIVALLALNSTFTHVAPRTHFFKEDLPYQEHRAQETGGRTGGLLSPDESSFGNHLHLLREGIETVARHPQGYGLGNAGVTALRSGVQLKAGESTYTELGVEAGALGGLAFVAWSLALLIALGRAARRAADETRRWAAATMTASFALVLALAIQTDVLGVLWLAFGVWWLAGALVEDRPYTRPA